MKKIITVLSLTMASLPQLLLAQGSPGGGQGSPGGGQGSSGGNLSQSGQGSVSLFNPLGQDSTLIGFFQEILAVILVFAVPLIVFFIILAGFNYVMARGNPGKIETANKALLYAVIGGVIILGAYVILEVISGTIDAFR